MYYVLTNPKINLPQNNVGRGYRINSSRQFRAGHLLQANPAPPRPDLATYSHVPLFIAFVVLQNRPQLIQDRA